MPVPYDYFGITELKDAAAWQGLANYDFFFSAYNLAERVSTSYDHIAANTKTWIIQSCLNLSEEDIANLAGVYQMDCTLGEGLNGKALVDSFGAIDWPAQKICVDITGFIKPWMFALLNELLDRGVKRIDCLYTEPMRYRDGARTKFSNEVITEVRLVQGYEGAHVIDTQSDVLVIGAGYDFESIKHVSEDKDRARRVLALGFPPLKADMYQENLLQVYEAEESLSTALQDKVLLAPANDPFVTARTISEFIGSTSYTNLYLSPLATEAQALGFALYFLLECKGKPVSILYPFCEGYPSSTSVGISRGWVYHVEIP